MKKCPFCAEEIQDEAIKCKHCQSMLTGTAPPTTLGPPKPKTRVAWVWVVLAVVLVGGLLVGVCGRSTTDTTESFNEKLSRCARECADRAPPNVQGEEFDKLYIKCQDECRRQLNPNAL